MSTAATSSSRRKLTEQNVIQMIAEALDISASQLRPDTKATDIATWDSMGILSILASLDRERIVCDIGDTAALQSVKGVLEVVRSADRLQ